MTDTFQEERCAKRMTQNYGVCEYEHNTESAGDGRCSCL